MFTQLPYAGIKTNCREKEVIFMRLLLAEDERPLSRALVAILQRNQYTVDAVFDGEAALEALSGGNYDGAVLDIMMPGLDGITVLQRLRARGDLLPVLLLTAKSEVDDKVLGLDSGANDYLTKPFAARELVARIRAMTRPQHDLAGSQLHLGNITLDRATFSLSSPSGRFQLSSKEFLMLELLLCCPGHPVSETRLLERIWGYDSGTERSVVWVYISYLRRKLEALHADVCIRSVPDAGYLLETCP